MTWKLVESQLTGGQAGTNPLGFSFGFFGDRPANVSFKENDFIVAHFHFLFVAFGRKKTRNDGTLIRLFGARHLAMFLCLLPKAVSVRECHRQVAACVLEAEVGQNIVRASTAQKKRNFSLLLTLGLAEV